MSATSTLFAVGDPDQCIYSFIGADSSLFEKMRTEVPNVEIVTLRANYRSQQPILDVADVLIKQDPERPILSPSVAPHSPLVSRLEPPISDLNLDLDPANTYPPPPPPAPRILRFLFPAAEHTWIATEIRRLVIDRNVPIEQIVVLARSSYAVKDLVEELKRKDLNPVLVGGASILESQAANLVLTIMRMLQFPSRNLFVWQLLRAYKLFLSPLALKTAMDRAQSQSQQPGTPLLKVLESHQLWVSSKGSPKIQEFLDMVQRAQSMLAENPTSLHTLLTTIRYVIDKVEYKKSIARKLSPANYGAKLRELEVLFEYLESLGPLVDDKVGNYGEEEEQATTKTTTGGGGEKTCLEVMLASTSFYSVKPQPGVS